MLPHCCLTTGQGEVSAGTPVATAVAGDHRAPQIKASLLNQGKDARLGERIREEKKVGGETSALVSPQKQLCYTVKLFSQATTNTYIHSSISEPFTEHEPLNLPTSSVAKRETKEGGLLRPS